MLAVIVPTRSNLTLTVLTLGVMIGGATLVMLNENVLSLTAPSATLVTLMVNVYV